MLVFAAVLVLHAPDTVHVELRRADASYAQLDPYPTRPPGDNLNDVLSTFQGIIADHGRVPGAEAGVGKCLFLLGSYREAAKAFRRAGARYRWRRDEASVYADVSNEINRQSKPLTVRQLRHVPGINRWVTILSSPAAKTGWYGFDDGPCKLAVYRRTRGTNRVEQVGKTEDMGEFWAGQFSTLYLVRLSMHDPTTRVLFFRQGRADCEPFDVRIFTVVPSGLKTIKTFQVYEGAWVRGASTAHGLLVSVGPAWHVDWSDVYEWTGQGFSFANRRFPRYFKVGHAHLNYTEWMKRAAELDIHGRFIDAEHAWNRALRACQIAIEHPKADSPYHDFGRHGDASENLNEIVRRLGWLARHQHNHALLYRPIDWGLQIPPYKLGKARNW